MPVLMFVIVSLASILGANTSPKEVALLGGGVAVFLTGSVVDASSGRALEGAQVYVPVASAGALTNSAGRFLVRLVDSYVGQEIEVAAELIGYASQRITLRLSEGEHVLEFRMEQTALRLDELVVTEAREQSADAARRAVSPTPAPIMLRAAPHVGVTHNTEAYAHIEESGFRPVATAPLSTFSIDVDRASYANVRRFIEDGQRPPLDAVRIEELINYFPYGGARPVGDARFAVTTEVTRAPWAPTHQLVRIGVRGQSIPMRDLPASNLVFLIDVSGSMSPENKLPLLQRSLRLLVDQLRPQDRVAIVVYAGAAGLVLPSTAGYRKQRIVAALDRLRAGGSTAGGAGLHLAYRVAQENFIEGGNNRVILATDGDFNVGASSDGDMVRLIEEKRAQGAFLTVLGFGRGNLKDSKMEQLADHGNGNFAYIDSELEAKKVLVSEMSGTLFTIAKDVKIQVEFNPARVAEYRLIGYENRLLADEDFNDDTKDAGELGAGHTVTALYEVVTTEAFGARPSVDPLRFQSSTPTATSDSEELMYVKLRYKEPDGEQSRLVEMPVFSWDEVDVASSDLRFASAVAAWGMILRDSEYTKDFRLSEVLALAGSALGEDAGGYRADFLRLVERTRVLELTATRRD